MTVQLPTRPVYARAEAILAEHGWRGATVYRVYSAGESEDGREEILFVNRKGIEKTAFVWREDGERRVSVRAGW